MNPSPPKVTVTPAGFIIFTSLVFVFLFGLFLLSPGPMAMGIAGLLLGATFRFLAGIPLRNLKLDRRLPKRAWVGESFAIDVRITNCSRFLPIADLQFRDPFSHAERAVTAVSPGSAVRINYTGKYGKRGPIVSRHIPFRSTWPLGLFETTCEASCEEESHLLLLPSPFLPARLQQHLDRIELEAQWSQLDLPDPAAEFRLLREFRHGDPVRSIHWPSSLRSDTLQVRESDPPGLKPLRHGLIIHSFTPSGLLVTPERYEMLLRIAIALLLRFRDRKVELLYYSGSGKPALLSAAVEYNDAIDGLATLSRTPISNLESIFDLKKTYRSCDEVFVLGDSPKESWQAPVRKAIPQCTCIDADSLSTASRPALKKQLRKEVAS